MQVKDMVYNGGHDYACWRINLASALMQLLPGPNALPPLSALETAEASGQAK